MPATLPVVLIADDQPHIALTLDFLIRSLGEVKVMVARDGNHAIDLALQLRPALVLLDVMMPEIDGFTVARRIRTGWLENAGQVAGTTSEQPSTDAPGQTPGNLPGEIWFVSARGSRTDYAHAKSMGADRYLTKPFDPDALLRDVRAYLSHWKQLHAA